MNDYDDNTDECNSTNMDSESSIKTINNFEPYYRKDLIHGKLTTVILQVFDFDVEFFKLG